MIAVKVCIYYRCEWPLECGLNKLNSLVCMVYVAGINQGVVRGPNTQHVVARQPPALENMDP